MDLATGAFAISLLSISVAELGDKTQLALAMLSASLREPRAIFLGAIAGFAVIAGASVLMVQALLAMLLLPLPTLIPGLIFVAVGILMFKLKTEEDIPSIRLGKPFQTAAPMIVLTELGCDFP